MGMNNAMACPNCDGAGSTFSADGSAHRCALCNGARKIDRAGHESRCAKQAADRASAEENTLATLRDLYRQARNGNREAIRIARDVIPMLSAKNVYTVERAFDALGAA